MELFLAELLCPANEQHIDGPLAEHSESASLVIIVGGRELVMFATSHPAALSLLKKNETHAATEVEGRAWARGSNHGNGVFSSTQQDRHLLRQRRGTE